VELRDRLRKTLAEIRTLHSETITMPIVRTTAFANTQPLLEECLQQQLRSTPRRAQWLLAIVAVVVSLIAGVMSWRAIEASHRVEAAARKEVAMRAAYKDTLQAAPGIVVTSVDRIDGLYRIAGLRDPRAPEPLRLIARAGLPPPVLELRPFDSLDPRLGTPYGAAEAALHALEQAEIRYPNAVADLANDDPEVRHAAQLIRVAHGAALHLGAGLCVQVFGDASPVGDNVLNLLLRSQRAQSAVEALTAAGIPREILEPRVEDPFGAGEHQARVSFRGVLRPDPRQPRCRT
jgi:hypothetical protein